MSVNIGTIADGTFYYADLYGTGDIDMANKSGLDGKSVQAWQVLTTAINETLGIDVEHDATVDMDFYLTIIVSEI